MEIPIIILNWNGWNDTEACIDALMQQRKQDFYVYLVDNGSTDGSPEKLKNNYANHPKIKLILNKDNLGFTKGNNEVLSKFILPNAAYKYVILLNNDTVPTKDWLEKLIQSAEKHQAAIVSSKMIDFYDPDKMDNAGHMMLNTGEVLPIGHGESVEKYNTGFENMGACAGAALYRTDMLQAIGIFDEHFNTGYEDAELGVRAVVLGYKCWYEPTARVYHKMGQSIKKIFNYEYALRIQKNILYSYFKLMPLGIIILSIPFLIFRYLIMTIIGIFFYRLGYLKILLQSLKETIQHDISVIAKARKQFAAKKKKNFLSSLSLLGRFHFFLWFDLKRFYKYIIQNKLSSLESYGKMRKTVNDK